MNQQACTVTVLTKLNNIVNSYYITNLIQTHTYDIILKKERLEMGWKFFRSTELNVDFSKNDHTIIDLKSHRKISELTNRFTMWVIIETIRSIQWCKWLEGREQEQQIDFSDD